MDTDERIFTAAQEKENADRAKAVKSPTDEEVDAMLLHKPLNFTPVSEPDVAVGSFLHQGVAMEAHGIIHGPRRKSYGPVEQSFQEIAKLIELLLPRFSGVTAHDVSMIMICVKLIREKANHARDNLVDLCGYADLREQLFNALGDPNEPKKEAQSARGSNRNVDRIPPSVRDNNAGYAPDHRPDSPIPRVLADEHIHRPERSS